MNGFIARGDHRTVRFEQYRGKFYRLLHPRPTVVLITGCRGRLNAAPFSWNTPVSEDPPTVAVAVGRGSFTRECLRTNPEATLNVIPPEMADAAYALLGIELEPSSMVSIPGLAGAVAIYEVRIAGSVEVGSMDLVLLRVLAVRARAGVADEDGLILEKANVALHGAGNEFFRVDPRPLIPSHP